MSKEAIARVLDAEAEANAIRERANVEARNRVETCERECALKVTRETEATAVELKARLETVRRRADTLIEQSREEAGADIEAMQAAAHERMREAIKHIEWELCDI